MSDEHPDRPGRSASFGWSRRSVMQALGASTVATAATGQAAGASEDTGGSDRSVGTVLRDCPPTCIDRYFGHAGPMAEKEKIPANLRPRHEIDNLIEDADRVFSDDPDSGPFANFPDFFFDPVGVRLRPGQTILFNNPYALHTASAFHPDIEGLPRRIPEGRDPFTSPPLFGGTYWLYGFDEPGVYDIACLPHLFLGMVMRVVVVEKGGEIPSAEPTDSLRNMGLFLPADVYDTDVLAPENIVEEGVVNWSDLPQLGYSPEILGGP